jgi:tRNA threonylcarbamoyl adenosine modification protein YeaZ/ribosomal-protein-alanine acetyltransferase
MWAHLRTITRPMLILALDTSMAACSACVYKMGAGTVLAAKQAFMDKGQAEALAPMIQETMREAGVAFADISRIAVTTGPGTFTGVRIGLAFARGLGVSLAIPVIGVNSLAAIAANEKSGSHPIIVASDARGGNIYFATFDANGRELAPPKIVGPDDIAVPAQTCILLGTGADAILKSHQHVRGTGGDLPIAANFVRLAANLQSAEFPPEPLYLRAPDVKLPITYSVVGKPAAKLLAEIHAECFEHPWNEASFSELLTGSAAVLASNQQTPTGFVLFRKAADEAEILTICTRGPFRQKGLAKALVQHMERLLIAPGIKSLFIEVAASNQAALALYAACGFKTTGLRKNYYERENGVAEDAHIMRKGL